MAGLILDGDEQHTSGATGPLSHQYDAGDGEAHAVVHPRQIGTTDDALCVEIAPQEGNRMLPQTEPDTAIVFHDFAAGSHGGQIDGGLAVILIAVGWRACIEQ